MVSWKKHIHDMHVCVFLISFCKATTEPSYVKFSHVEKGLVNGINTNVHTHTWCARCSVVSDFAKVFLWVLCGHGIRAGLSPGRAALIMRPLKMGRGAASTSLVQTPSELLLQGSAEKLWQHWAGAELHESLYYENIVLPCRFTSHCK